MQGTPSDTCTDDRQWSGLSSCQAKADHSRTKVMLLHMWNLHQYLWNCLLQVSVVEKLYFEDLHTSIVMHLQLEEKNYVILQWTLIKYATEIWMYGVIKVYSLCNCKHDTLWIFCKSKVWWPLILQLWGLQILFSVALFSKSNAQLLLSCSHRMLTAQPPN